MVRKNDISVDAVRYEQNDTSGNHPQLTEGNAERSTQTCDSQIK